MKANMRTTLIGLSFLKKSFSKKNHFRVISKRHFNHFTGGLTTRLLCCYFASQRWLTWHVEYREQMTLQSSFLCDYLLIGSS